ncbi:MAG: hypothetical protein QM817_37595 [Archangium sp.]
MTSLLVALSLSCTIQVIRQSTPEFEGPEGMRLLQKDLPSGGRQVELVDANGKTVWKNRKLPRLEAVRFSADGRTIAFTDSSLEVTMVDAKGRPRTVKFWKALSDLEREAIPRTNCGYRWLEKYEFDASGRLLVSILQRDSVPVLVFVDPANGTVSREKV